MQSLSRWCMPVVASRRDRKSTRLNSSHTVISYAVFCLKKKIRKVDMRLDGKTEKDMSALLVAVLCDRPGFVLETSTFLCRVLFFFNDTATTEIYTLSLHDALPI